MKQPEKCKSLKEVRSAIDQIDNKIVKLLAEREKYVSQASKFKSDLGENINDESRNREVIESRMKLADKYGISPEFVGSIYKYLIQHFVKNEMRKWKISAR